MLRFISRSITCFTNPSLPQHKLTQITNFRRFSSFARTRLKDSTSSSCFSGCMSEVLQILGPFDHGFPTFDLKFYVNLLKKCIRTGNFFVGTLMHSHILKFGLDAEILVSNVLLDMYAKVGCFGSCALVFDEMREKDLISWCTVISGFVSHGYDLEAYGLFKRMLSSGLQPNHFVVSSLLKGCSVSGVLELGLPVHGLIMKSGLNFDRFVEIGLVGVYAKCGAMEDAQKLFYDIPVKSSVSWNAMISGYAQNGYLDKALELFCEMYLVGLAVDLVTLRIVASVACALELFNFAKNLHSYSIKIGYGSDSFVVAELVKLLSKVEEVSYLRKLFKAVKKPDGSLYSLLISAYHLLGHRTGALLLAKDLLKIKFNPLQGSIVSVIDICQYKEEGTQIHCHIIRSGHIFCLSIGNALISMYSRFGKVDYANMVFLEMRVRDVVTWTARMAALAHNFKFWEALRVFQAFRYSNIHIDKHLIVTTINACAGLQDSDNGMQMHAMAVKLGMDSSSFTVISLIHMYAKCRYMDSATMLFSLISIPHDVITINIMLAGYCWNSQPRKALNLFCREYHSGFVPDNFSLSIILGACTDMKSLVSGEQIHCHIVKSGFEVYDDIIGKAMINLYLKSGSIGSACKFFYTRKTWDLHTFSSLMFKYIQSRSHEDLQLFHQVRRSGLLGKLTAFTRILKRCGVVSSVVPETPTPTYKAGFITEVFQSHPSTGIEIESCDISKEAACSGEKSGNESFSNGLMCKQHTEDKNRQEYNRSVDEFDLEETKQAYFSFFDVLNMNQTFASLE